MRKTLCSLILMLLLPTAGFSQTFLYFDGAGTSGSGNNCQTYTNPCNFHFDEMERVMVANSVLLIDDRDAVGDLGGDSVHNCGASSNDSLNLDFPDVSVGVYSREDGPAQIGITEYLPPTQKPFITGNEQADNHGIRINYTAPRYFVDNIRIAYLYTCSDVAARQCTQISPPGAHGILVVADRESNAVEGKITNNLIHDVWSSGIIINKNNSSGNAPDNGTIQRNHVYRTSLKMWWSGSSLDFLHGINVNAGGFNTKYNLVHDVWGECMHPGSQADFQYNIMGICRSVGIYVDARGTDSKVMNNLVIGRIANGPEELESNYGFNGNGIKVSIERSPNPENMSRVNISNNVIVNWLNGLKLDCQACEDQTHTMSDIWLYNNHFIDCRNNINLTAYSTNLSGFNIVNSTSLVYMSTEAGHVLCNACNTVPAGWLNFDTVRFYGNDRENKNTIEQIDALLGNESTTNSSFTPTNPLTRSLWRESMNDVFLNLLAAFTATDFEPVDGSDIIDAGLNLGQPFDEAFIVSLWDFFTVGNTANPDDIVSGTDSQNNYNLWELGSVIKETEDPPSPPSPLPEKSLQGVTLQ